MGKRRRWAVLGFAAAALAFAAWVVARPGGEEREHLPAGVGTLPDDAGGIPRLAGRGRDPGAEDPRPREVVVLMVVDDLGSPVASARVQVRRERGGTTEHWAKDGRVEIPKALLDPGSVVRVDRAQDAEERDLPLAATAFRVPAEGGLPRTLRLDPGRDLEVTVLDDQGLALSGIVVHVWPVRNEASEETGLGALPSGTTDAQGRAHLPHLPRIPLQVALWGEFGRVGDVDVDGSETRVTVRLPASPTIEGRVVDPAGRILPHATVTAGGWDDGEWWTRSVRADASGRFRLRSLPPTGTPRLTATPPEGPDSARLAPAIRDDVPVGSRDVEMRLPPLAEIRGEVLDSSGRPATVFEVRCTAEGTDGLGDPHRAGPLSEGSHHFAVAGLAPGRYRLEVLSPGEDPGRAEVLGVEAPAEGVVVRLEAATVVKGRVGEGSTAGLMAWWWWPGGGPAVADVDRDGTFEIRGVPRVPGTLYVGGLGTDRCALVRHARPGPQVLEVDLAAAPRISGHVEFAQDVFPGIVYVVLTGDGFELWEEVDRNGRFTVRGVPSGSYEVALAVDDVRGPSQGRVVAGAEDVVVRYVPTR